MHDLQTGGPEAYIAAQQDQARRDMAARARCLGASLWHPARLQALGWYRSRAGHICDGQGAALPWLAYAATAWLDAQCHPDWRVLEYGLGSSSLWWAERVRDLTIIEHDPAWIARLAPQLPAHVRLLQIDQGDPAYRDFCRQTEQRWDLISVDGKRRNSVIKRAAEALVPGGLLLFDDSQKVRYAKPLAKLERRGFEALHFWDAKPLQSYAGKTTILRAPRAGCAEEEPKT